MKLKIAFLAGAAVLCLAQFAEAQNFNSTIVFGDSSLDSGWFTGATSGPHSTGIPTYDASIAAALAAGGNGHFTGPGLNNSQIVAGFFGLSANSAGTPGGTNYAIGGAVDYLVPPGYPVTGNLFPNPLLPGTATQISNYLTSVNGKANPNALYLLNSGANDATAALDVFGPNSAAAKAYLLGEAQILTNSVAQLQADGARYIIVSNYYGNVAAYQNTIVSATWSDFAAAGIKFIPADTLSVIAAVATNRAAYGLPPASSYACIPPAFLTGQTGYGVTCVPTTVPNPNYGYLVSANATQTHLYMDGVHLTQAGQTIIADYYYDLLTAPSQISFLAESAIQTTFGMIYGIQQQIDVSQRQAPAGWNFWVNGDLSYLQMNNSSSGFPNDPGIPISGSLGFDYHWTSGWLVGAAVTGGFLDSTFSTGGGFTQNVGALSLYAAYRSSEWWANLIGSVGWLNFSTNRPVPIGITVQPNNGSTFGTDLSLAGEVGYEFHAGAIAHGPVAGFIVQQAMINGFTESGSYTSLSFGNQLLNSDVSLLGYQANLNWGVWHPFAQVVWDHDFAPLNRVVNASLTTIAAPGYSLPAAVVGRDWATATVGTEFKIAASWTGLASVTAELGQQNVINYGGMLGVNYAFAQQPLAPIVYKN
jgi:outer membrane lipase/esterase